MNHPRVYSSMCNPDRRCISCGCLLGDMRAGTIYCSPKCRVAGNRLKWRELTIGTPAGDRAAEKERQAPSSKVRAKRVTRKVKGKAPRAKRTQKKKARRKKK